MNASGPQTMCSPRSNALAIALAALLLATSSASATTLRTMNLDQLAHDASDIVVGSVDDVHSRWSDDHTLIVTEVKLHISDQLKGAGGARMIVLLPGGEVDGTRVEVDAVPAFQVGEQCVVFARHEASGPLHVLGMAQGKFEITPDPRSGELLVQRSAEGFAFRDVRSLRMARASEVPARVTLPHFLSQIRSAVAAAGSTR